MIDAPVKLSATFRVRDIAERFGVDRAKVLAWIGRGELRAVNVADKIGGRPRYRVTLDAILAFEAALSTVPLPKVSRRRAKAGWTPQYFTE